MGSVASTTGSKSKTFQKAPPTEQHEEADQKYIKEETEVGISTASEETNVKTPRSQVRSSSKTPRSSELEQTPRLSKIQTPRSRIRSRSKTPKHSEFENEDGENLILEGNWEVEKGNDEACYFE
ncbi:hypothetical protein CHS0354_027765 [Potamilus streckersoni]|uniref:Uncharacterized protein n=1 Tax=Potamilus streckersoni TaxID=2493646 RepID=A0AAE0T2U1_9BIVA|nr:hypothetical protein CHS0354_027765 [Potamilus streckersoni]